MPTIDGRLMPDEIQKLVSYFTELETRTGRALICEACGTSTWEINPFVLGLISDSPDLLGVQRFRTPTVMIHCQNCGNEKFFMAVKVGINPVVKPPVSGRSASEGADGN